MGKRVLAVACLLALTFALSGCVFSEAITERVYDDNEDSIVDPDIAPFIINSPTAEQTTDALPKLYDDPDSDDRSDKEYKLPLYSPDESKANTDMPGVQVVYDEQVGEETGEAAKQASEDAQTEQEQGASPTEDKSSNGAMAAEGEGDKNSDSGDDNPDEEDDGEENDPAGDDAPDDENNGARVSGGTGSVYTNDNFAQPPVIPDNIDEVAAVGNAAVIVSMVAGSSDRSALLACDADTKAKMGAILAARGIGNVPALWANDGSSEGDLSEGEFNRLVNEVVPDLVFVTEGEGTLTDAQIVALEDSSIDVYYLPRLTSATRIKFAVKAVGMTLARGGVEGAEQNYQAYLTYHDDLVNRFVSANGGIAGGFNFDTETDTGASAPLATLYVDEWDSDARLTDPSGYLSTSYGVGLSSMGYTSSPINYYLSTGGVLNNAASSLMRTYATSGHGIVWQFARNELDFSFARWSGLRLATIDLASKINVGVYTSDLMWYSAGDAGLGSNRFPAVVAKNGTLAERLTRAAKKESDIYYSYPTIELTGSGHTVGYFTNKADNAFVEACIGYESGISSMAGQPFKVYVNPKGLAQENSDDDLCSWAGGSIESVLESSWAYYRFCGGSQTSFESDVQSFYQQFYGYTLSGDELAAIENGCAA